MAKKVVITVSGYDVFPCRIDCKVEDVTLLIRSRYGLRYGGIDKDGVAMFPAEVTTEVGTYQFVSFQSQGGCINSPAATHGIVERLKSPGNIARKMLTNAPAFNIIIGNFESIKKDIEGFLLSKKDSRKIKENLPYLCLINLPRYGKSLLLDQLFCAEKGVLVISITYNSTSPLSSPELDSVETALSYFWIRVFMSLSSDSISTLHDVYKEYGANCSSFEQVIGICNENLSAPITYDTDIVICVDEFSLVTDLAKKLWTSEQQTYFTNRLQEWKSTKPIRQYIMTGFNKEMTKLLRSASTVKPFALQHCSFRAAKPLLLKIYEKYDQFNKAKRFPVLIYECIKSSPGLIGQWAEFVSENLFIYDLEVFVKRINWLSLLTESKKNEGDDYSPLERNWNLVLQFLVYNEFSVKITSELENTLISSNLAINLQKSNDLELSPFPILALSRYYYVNAVQPREHLLRSINNQTEAIFKVIESYDTNKKHGKYFVEGCLRLRLLFRQLQQKEGFVKDHRLSEFQHNSHVLISTIDLIPTNSVYTCKINDVDFTLFIISRKQDLKKFLLNPLYHMFPVGISALKPAVNRADSSKGLVEMTAQNLALSEKSDVYSHKSNRFASSLEDFLREKMIILSDCSTSPDLLFPYLADSETGFKPLKFIIEKTEPDTEQFTSEFLQDFNRICSAYQGNHRSIEDFQKWSKDSGLVDYLAGVDPNYRRIGDKLLSRLDSLLKVISASSRTCFLPVNSSGEEEGIDVLIIAYNTDNELCFFAIELKDRRIVKPEELLQKLESLCSSRCLYNLVSSYLGVCGIKCKYQIVIAGRDHSHEDDSSSEEDA